MASLTTKSIVFVALLIQGCVGAALEKGAPQNAHNNRSLPPPLCEGNRTAVEAYLHGWTDELNKCLRSLIRADRTSFGIELSKSLPSTEILQVARYIDKYLPTVHVKLWPTPEALYFNSSVKILVGKASVGKEYIEDTLAPPPVTQDQRFRTTFIEPEVSQLSNSLGHPDSKPVVLTETPPTVSSRFPVSLFIRSVYNKLISGGLAQSKVGGDCRNYCVVETVASRESELSAIRSKFYIGGVPFRDIVAIKRLEELVAFLHLNLSGNISAIFFVDTAIEADSVVTRIEVYDRLWNKIGNENINILRDVTRKLDIARKIPAITVTANAVVLCETVDLEQFERDDLLHSLRQNQPNRSHGYSSSILGWLPNSKRLLSQFIDPLVELNGVFTSPDATTHGYKIASTLLSENENAALIPISKPNCQKHYSNWAGTASQYSVKVVNFSGTEPVDPACCRLFHDPSPYLGPNKPFLLVMAAGNSGSQNPALCCPQALGPVDNLIVVAGGSANGIWQHSDYGRNYADLVADHNSVVGSDAGTSYSAARVSATAAKIAGHYPMLSPVDIKLAILLGVEIPSHPLEVRSGGALAETYALALAGDLAELPQEKRRNLSSDDTKELLQNHFSPSESERRLNLWKERNLNDK